MEIKTYVISKTNTKMSLVSHWMYNRGMGKKNGVHKTLFYSKFSNKK